MKSQTKSLVFGIFFIVVVVGVFVFSEKKMVGSVVDGGEQFEDSFDVDLAKENCDCVAKNRFYCREGFELKENNCWKDKTFTNPLVGCSIYNCSNVIYSWNSETEVFEKE